MGEWDGDGNLQAWNVYGAGADEILWRHQAGVDHLRYHYDARGNVAFVLGGGGQGYERYTYDAFGQPTITDWDGNVRGQSTIGNRFMFQGREWIPELGIYGFRNRMYHPQLGRFLQIDPLGFDAGDMNLFRYCGDDPVNGSDPTGLHDQGDEAELAAWNSGVIVTGSAIDNSLYDPFSDPSRFTTAGLFDRWSNASLNDYYSNMTHEFGLRESSVAYSTNWFQTGSQALTVIGGMNTSADLMFSGGSFGIKGGRLKFYASGWSGGSRGRITTWKPGPFLRNAGVVGFFANVAFDTVGVATGRTTRGEAFANTAVGAYGLSGPMQAAAAAFYFGIKDFYPGGWLGDGSGVPYQGAGALSDYNTTIMLNRQVVPDWRPRDPGY